MCHLLYYTNATTSGPNLGCCASAGVATAKGDTEEPTATANNSQISLCHAKTQIQTILAKKKLTSR